MMSNAKNGKKPDGNANLKTKNRRGSSSSRRSSSNSFDELSNVHDMLPPSERYKLFVANQGIKKLDNKAGKRSFITRGSDADLSYSRKTSNTSQGSLTSSQFDSHGSSCDCNDCNGNSNDIGGSTSSNKCPPFSVGLQFKQQIEEGDSDSNQLGNIDDENIVGKLDPEILSSMPDDVLNEMLFMEAQSRELEKIEKKNQRRRSSKAKKRGTNEAVLGHDLDSNFGEMGLRSCDVGGDEKIKVAREDGKIESGQYLSHKKQEGRSSHLKYKVHHQKDDKHDDMQQNHQRQEVNQAPGGTRKTGQKVPYEVNINNNAMARRLVYRETNTSSDTEEKEEERTHSLSDEVKLLSASKKSSCEKSFQCEASAASTTNPLCGTPASRRGENNATALREAVVTNNNSRTNPQNPRTGATTGADSSNHTQTTSPMSTSNNENESFHRALAVAPSKDTKPTDISASPSKLSTLTKSFHTNCDISNRATNRTLRLPNDNAEYHGEYNMYGERHGKGLWINLKKKVRYEGTFVNGWKEGWGVYTMADGSVYEGHFKRDKFAGEGMMTFYDGNCYVGHFEDGQRHGQGKCTFTNGDIYVGTWEHGIIKGYGTYFFHSENNFVKAFPRNSKYGHFGDIKFAPNSNIRYEGYWDKGTPHGMGKYYLLDGKTFEGSFVSGKRHGPGKYMKRDGTMELCFFEQNSQRGDGVRMSSCRKKAWRVRGGKVRKHPSISAQVASTIANSCGYNVAGDLEELNRGTS